MSKNHSYNNNNVLIVDDNKTNILLLKSMLDDEGYDSTYSATSATEAYELLKQTDIDLILLDIGMPNIDGIEACQTIRETKKNKHTPIIMLTANNNDESIQKSFDVGANDFVSKPISLVNLNSRIKNVFLHKEKDMMIQNQTKSAAMNEIIELLSNRWKEPLHEIVEIASKIKKINNKSSQNYEIENSMNKINDYAQELSKTIDEVKNVSKLENNILNADINKLMKYALNIIKKSYKSKNISLQIKNAKEMEKILIFPNKVVKVLLNIFINSQEAFISSKKSSAAVVQVTTSQNEKYTKIVIKDNAGGISDENLSKIFNPDFTTKKKRSNAGLGLYSCKQIIEQHQGGRLNVTSEKNITEVSIELLNNSPYIQNSHI